MKFATLTSTQIRTYTEDAWENYAMENTMEQPFNVNRFKGFCHPTFHFSDPKSKYQC
jgi:hypothetical protein